MSSVAGHQPNLFPYPGYFAKAAAVDTFVIVDTTQYVKKQYHNRNKIKLSDGQAHWLSVPVVNAGRYQQSIRECEIEPGAPWKKAHLKTLSLNYAKAPYFDLYFSQFEALYHRDWSRLPEFSVAIIRLCFELLEIDTPILMGSDLGIEGKATELIADICRKTGADTYLHGAHAVDYVDFDVLKSHGLNSLLQEYHAQPYAQQHGPFIADLSILDMLFNCGSDSSRIMLEGNTIRDA